jgi:hypothetical protein
MLRRSGHVFALNCTAGKTIAMITFFLLSVSACTSIEGTRDKSQTFFRTNFSTPIERIAILPLANSAASPQLSAQLGHAVTSALQAEFSQARVVSPSDFSAALSQHNAVEIYSQWKVAYEQTSILNPQPLATFAKAAGAQHFLMVRAISLDREKVRAVDTGRSGVVHDAWNVWRARLRFTAEVLDASSGTVVWSGMGEAEDVKSPRRDLDLGLVVLQKGVADLDTYLPEMCQVAATGLVRQLRSGPMGSVIALSTSSTAIVAPEASLTPHAVEQTTAAQHQAETSGQQGALSQMARPQALQCDDVSMRAMCTTVPTGNARFRTSCQDGSGLETSISRAGDMSVEFIAPESTGYVRIQAGPVMWQAKRCVLTAVR